MTDNIQDVVGEWVGKHHYLVQIHEKMGNGNYALKKKILSTILELHFEVNERKIHIDKQDIVVGGIR